MEQMTLPQVYRRAVEILDERGWYQGYYVDPEGCKLCAAGALAVALGGEPTPGDEESPVLRWPNGNSGEVQMVWLQSIALLAETIGDRGVAAWNDTPGRTVDQVKAALVRAAEEAERDG